MNFVISPLHKNEADRLLIVLAIGLLQAVKEGVYSREYCNEYFFNNESIAMLTVLDSTALDIIKRSPTESISTAYKKLVAVLKSLPDWSDNDEAWINYEIAKELGKASKEYYVRFWVEGKKETVKLVSLISLGLACLLGKNAISVDDAEMILFKPYLGKMFEKVDADVCNIIECGTYLEDVDAFESMDIETEISKLHDMSVKKLSSFPVEQCIEHMIRAENLPIPN